MREKNIFIDNERKTCGGNHTEDNKVSAGGPSGMRK